LVDLKPGDRVRVRPRPHYSLSGLTGEVVEVKGEPKGWVVLRADKTGYLMGLHERELEKDEGAPP